MLLGLAASSAVAADADSRSQPQLLHKRVKRDHQPMVGEWQRLNKRQDPAASTTSSTAPAAATPTGETSPSDAEQAAVVNLAPTDPVQAAIMAANLPGQNPPGNNAYKAITLVPQDATGDVVQLPANAQIPVIPNAVAESVTLPQFTDANGARTRAGKRCRRI